MSRQRLVHIADLRDRMRLRAARERRARVAFWALMCVLAPLFAIGALSLVNAFADWWSAQPW